MLRNGSVAPDFSLESLNGADISLNSFKGKPVILIFVRGKFCPTTYRYLAAYQDFYGRIKDLGCELICICTDKNEDLLTLSNEIHISFPLLSDVEHTVGDNYGVYKDLRKSGRAFSEPAVIIVDKNGKIAYQVISSGPKGLPSPGDIAPVLLYMWKHEGVY